jgi:3-hydroxymyristoyl/3-hydroxydecanoyl-(acyl carrier protein) dehydratase
MEHHFRAFSFVDRITSVEPGHSVRGSYSIPSRLESFSSSLAAEAVGQLAAWAAMATVDFDRRPVAGLAGKIELLAPVQPGQLLELAVDLESVDAEAAAYGGTASVDGRLVLRLHHCVGPMLPVADFDEPQALRERFAVLCGAGAAPGAFGGVPGLSPERCNGVPGRFATATLKIPDSAPLFADHFPRRPVFPGSLLMGSKLELAARLAAEMPPPAAGGRWTLLAVADMKLRSFLAPGETLEVAASVEECSADAAKVVLEARKGKRLVGAANVLLGAEATS